MESNLSIQRNKDEEEASYSQAEDKELPRNFRQKSRTKISYEE
jgi:hypothetical protein